MRKQLFIILAFLTFFNSQLTAQNDSRIIYKANEKGEKIEGSLSELIAHVNQGYSLRVGWEIKGVDINQKEIIIKHWTDASFITIHKGHVFAQLNSIFEQGVSFGKNPSVFLAKGKADGWVAIIGTNGQLKQKFTNEHINKLPKEVLKEMENITVKTTWVATGN